MWRIRMLRDDSGTFTVIAVHDSKKAVVACDGPAAEKALYWMKKRLRSCQPTFGLALRPQFC